MLGFRGIMPAALLDLEGSHSSTASRYESQKVLGKSGHPPNPFSPAGQKKEKQDESQKRQFNRIPEGSSPRAEVGVSPLTVERLEL